MIKFMSYVFSLWAPGIVRFNPLTIKMNNIYL